MAIHILPGRSFVARQLTLRRRSDTLMVGQKGCLKFLYTWSVGPFAGAALSKWTAFPRFSPLLPQFFHPIHGSLTRGQRSGTVALIEKGVSMSYSRKTQRAISARCAKQGLRSPNRNRCVVTNLDVNF